MRFNRLILSSFIVGLSVVACQPPEKTDDPPKEDEQDKTPEEKSADASLSALSLSAGSLSPTFAAGTTTYTIDVAYPTATTTLTATPTNAKASIQLNETALSAGTASGALPLAIGANAFTLVVTAEDGATKRTYAVTVNRPAPSADATLSALSFSASALQPAFDASVTTYAFDVTSAVGSTTLTATTTQATATLQINESAAISGEESTALALADGPNTIAIVVTAEDGTTQKTYTVTITKLTEEADATLSALAPSVGTFDSAFSPFDLAYNLDVAHDVTEIAFTPTASRPGAVITLSATPVASGTTSDPVALPAPGTYDVVLLVTAEDGSTMLSYTIHVRRLSATDLSALAISSGTLTPAFDADTLSYSADVPFATTDIDVTATLADATATLAVAGNAATSGAAEAIALVVGTNTFSVVVTGNGGSPTRTYTLTVTRAPSDNAKLAALELAHATTPITLNTPFDADTYAYTAGVAEDVAEISVQATRDDANAVVVVSVDGAPIASTSGGYPISLGETGTSTDVTITVTAQDGTTELSYVVTVSRAESSNAKLQSLTLDAAFTPTFSADDTAYTSEVASDIAELSLALAAAHASASVAVSVAIDSDPSTPLAPVDDAYSITLGAPDSTTVITIVVTAQDGSDNTYTLSVHRAEVI